MVKRKLPTRSAANSSAFSVMLQPITIWLSASTSCNKGTSIKYSIWGYRTTTHKYECQSTSTSQTATKQIAVHDIDSNNEYAFLQLKCAMWIAYNYENPSVISRADLARLANLPTGLYILLAIIDFLLNQPKIYQHLLGQFSWFFSPNGSYLREFYRSGPLFAIP